MSSTTTHVAGQARHVPTTGHDALSRGPARVVHEANFDDSWQSSEAFTCQRPTLSWVEHPEKHPDVHVRKPARMHTEQGGYEQHFVVVCRRGCRPHLLPMASSSSRNVASVIPHAGKSSSLQPLSPKRRCSGLANRSKLHQDTPTTSCDVSTRTRCVAGHNHAPNARAVHSCSGFQHLYPQRKRHSRSLPTTL